MRKIVLWICLLVTSVLYAQETSLSVKLSQGHPRYLTDSNGKVETQKLIKEEPWAQEVFEKLKQRTDRYADRGPEWLTSRLQMYWKTHATEVYIKGEYYDHAGGEKAPAPTVMYTGARSHAANYVRPKLEYLKPYQEDARGMYLANGTLEGRPYEWVNISKTGNIIQSINVEILGIARDAELVKNSNCKILSVLIFVVSIALFFVGLTVVDLNAFESCHFVFAEQRGIGSAPEIPHQIKLMGFPH